MILKSKVKFYKSKTFKNSDKPFMPFISIYVAHMDNVLGTTLGSRNSDRKTRGCPHEAYPLVTSKLS